MCVVEIHFISKGENNPNKFFIIGGHLFKNPSGKIFELDSST